MYEAKNANWETKRAKLSSKVFPHDSLCAEITLPPKILESKAGRAIKVRWRGKTLSAGVNKGTHHRWVKYNRNTAMRFFNFEAFSANRAVQSDKCATAPRKWKVLRQCSRSRIVQSRRNSLWVVLSRSLHLGSQRYLGLSLYSSYYWMPTDQSNHISLPDLGVYQGNLAVPIVWPLNAYGGLLLPLSC